VEEVVLFQIFNYFVENVTEVNLIVAIVKYTIKKLVLIVVVVIQLKNTHNLPNNAMEPLKKESDVKIELKIKMGAVITTNKKRVMNMSFLFAIDINTQEVIVSESNKRTNNINFIERINQRDNDILFNAVITLTSITKSSSFDEKIFKSMYNVCQMMYCKHKEYKR
tara:strand:+ start:11275 stop:11772 length:498 start_codon:yes stop_codon:yes gene_type:complete